MKDARRTVTSVTSLSSERVYASGQMASAIRGSGQTIASAHMLREMDPYSDSCNSEKAMLDKKSADWNERGSGCI